MNKIFPGRGVKWTQVPSAERTSFRVHVPLLAQEIPQLFSSLGEVKLNSQDGDDVIVDISLHSPMIIAHRRTESHDLGQVLIDGDNQLGGQMFGVQVLSPVESGQMNMKLKITLAQDFTKKTKFSVDDARFDLQRIPDRLRHPWVVVPR